MARMSEAVAIQVDQAQAQVAKERIHFLVNKRSKLIGLEHLPGVAQKIRSLTMEIKELRA